MQKKIRSTRPLNGIFIYILFLFVHCFVINLVNGLHSFLHKVLNLFYVKIHAPYKLAYKSNSI